MPRVGEDIEQLELLYTAGGNLICKTILEN